MIGVVPTLFVMAVGEVEQKLCVLSEVSGEVLRDGYKGSSKPCI